MKDNDKINQLVNDLKKVLDEQNLTFEEYMIYKYLKSYEQNGASHLKSLEDKGLVKDNKVVSMEHFMETEKAIADFVKSSPIDSDDKDLKNYVDFLIDLSLYRSEQ